MNIVIAILRTAGYAVMIAIFVRVVYSYIEPYPKSQVHRLAFKVTEPILQPIRSRLPTGPGVDFSPMVVTLVLAVVLSFLR